MPVVHVVTLTFKADTAESVLAGLATELDELGGRANAISFRHGGDLRIREGNADYAITAVFDDERAFATYMADPEHQRIIRELVTPNLHSRSAVQFSVKG